MLPVACNHRQIVGAVVCALAYETTQIGFVANLVGTHTASGCPYMSALVNISFGEHPSQHNAHVVDVVDNREDACCLKVVAALNSCDVDAMLVSPRSEAVAEEFYIGKRSAEGIVESVWAYSPLVGTYGHNIDTLARCER